MDRVADYLSVDPTLDGFVLVGELHAYVSKTIRINSVSSGLYAFFRADQCLYVGITSRKLRRRLREYRTHFNDKTYPRSVHRGIAPRLDDGEVIHVYIEERPGETFPQLQVREDILKAKWQPLYNDD
jgi:hypothetical protein